VNVDVVVEDEADFGVDLELEDEEEEAEAVVAVVGAVDVVVERREKRNGFLSPSLVAW
jgi:hypothetical protein